MGAKGHEAALRGALLISTVHSDLRHWRYSYSIHKIFIDSSCVEICCQPAREVAETNMRIRGRFVGWALATPILCRDRLSHTCALAPFCIRNRQGRNWVRQDWPVQRRPLRACTQPVLSHAANANSPALPSLPILIPHQSPPSVPSLSCSSPILVRFNSFLPSPHFPSSSPFSPFRVIVLDHVLECQPVAAR